MAWDFELLAGPFGGTAEGPAWDGQALLFTHIPESRIMRYDPANGEVSVHRTDTRNTNGLMFDAQGRLYGCQSGDFRIVRFEPDGSQTPLPICIGFGISRPEHVKLLAPVADGQPGRCIRTVYLGPGIAAIYSFDEDVLMNWRRFDPAVQPALKQIGAL